MIEVVHRKGRISVVGHADYAPFGRDIVCAGVSALVQTFVESVSMLTDDEILIDMASGYTAIRYENLSENGQLLLDSFFIGLNMIAESYPNNVRVLA